MIYSVLAGGKSTRMGENKSFLMFGEKYILEMLLERFRPEQVYLSSADGGVGKKLIHLDWRPVEIADCVAYAGPAGAVYSLLKKLGEPVFVVATDMPFADVRLSRILVALGQEQADGMPDMIVLERLDGRREMLFGYYGLGCLEPLEQMILEKNYRLRDLCAKVSCAVVGEAQVACAYGPGYTDVLLNMNTPKDYKTALAMAGINYLSCDCPKFTD